MIQRRAMGLDKEVDHGPVVDLRAERRCPEDQCDEREHRPDDERVEDPAGVIPTTAEKHEESERDRQRDEQDHQEEATPAEEATEGDGDKRPQRLHRLTR